MNKRVIFCSLVLLISNLQASIQIESTPYLARKKKILQESLLYFAKQDKQKNLSLLQYLLSEKKELSRGELLREIEENLVIAQIITEETEDLRIILEKDSRNFITCLLLSTFGLEQVERESMAITRIKKNSFFSMATLGLATIVIIALCYTYVVVCSSATLPKLADCPELASDGAVSGDVEQLSVENCFAATLSTIDDLRNTKNPN